MNIKPSFHAIVDQVITNLKSSKVSPYFILDLEEAKRLYTIISLCYAGKNELTVSFWDKSGNAIAFKTYPSTYTRKGITFLQSQKEGLINSVGYIKLPDEDTEFLESRNYFN